MTIERILRAIQRTSHLSFADMEVQFPELYELLFEEQLSETGFQTRLATRSLIAQIQGRACPLPMPIDCPNYPA